MQPRTLTSHPARLQRGQTVQKLGRAGITALAGVGRERENPRSRAKARPAALKVQLCAVRPTCGPEGEEMQLVKAGNQSDSARDRPHQARELAMLVDRSLNHPTARMR